MRTALHEFIVARTRQLLPIEQVLPNEGRRDALRVIDEVVAEAALHAQVAVIDGRVERRGHAVNEVVLDVELQTASHAAVGTGGRDNAVGLHHAASAPGRFLRFFRPVYSTVISCGLNPCSSRYSRLGLSAPVGQTP